MSSNDLLNHPNLPQIKKNPEFELVSRVDDSNCESYWVVPVTIWGGDANKRLSVGKSTLQQQMADSPTPPVEGYQEFMRNYDNVQYNFQTCDYNYIYCRPVSRSSFHVSQLHFLVFDINNRLSFDSICHKWLPGVVNCGNQYKSTFVLIANKIDLPAENRRVFQHEIEQLLQMYSNESITYYETSFTNDPKGLINIIDHELKKYVGLYGPDGGYNHYAMQHRDVDMEEKVVKEEKKKRGCAIM